MKFRGTSVVGKGRGRDPKGFEQKQNRKREGSHVPKTQGTEGSAVLNAAKGQEDQFIRFSN